MDKNKKFKITLNIVSAIGFLTCLAAMIYLSTTGIASDQEKLNRFIHDMGAFGALAYIFMQLVQVVIPIIPGGIGCAVGVMAFGTLRGFIYNYIGICLGSFLIFFISKSWGTYLMHLFFNEKKVEKYQKWVQKNKYTLLFAIGIFLPIAPDDLLCYIAGTTTMRFRTFAFIILLGKPLSIFLYSEGIRYLFVHIINIMN